MSDDEVESASPEQKLAIAKYFLLSSPVGELEQVLADVKSLLGGDDVLTKDNLVKTLRQYNTEQMIAANDIGRDGKSVLITKYGEVDAETNSYLDPSTGRILLFDHKDKKFTGVADKKQVLSEKVESARKAIETVVESYVETAYKKQKCHSATYGFDNGQIVICLSAANIHLGAFWTGSWRSVHKLDIANKGKTTMESVIIARVHYFEDGNVQLMTTIDKKSSITVADDAATAKDVAKAINTVETDFQNGLEEMYVKMHQTTFKAMRRFLPVSQQMMNWNLAAHQMVGEVAK